MIRMSRQKEEDRPRSVRIPMSEEMFRWTHALAGKVPISVYLRDLIEAEAIKAGLVKKGKKR